MGHTITTMPKHGLGIGGTDSTTVANMGETGSMNEAATATDALPALPALPDGLVAVVKRDCPTCVLVGPVLASLQVESTEPVTLVCQDDPTFPEGAGDVTDDRELSLSWHHDIETVPTLLRVVDGAETERIVGWSVDQWRTFTGDENLGEGLPEHRPGCGSLSVDPNLAPGLEAKFGSSGLAARRVEFAALEDPVDAMYERGWTDGLPVVPPTVERVQAMLAGTTRDPSDVVAMVPPDLASCTVEKVAINAVMAGCRPEYLPVVIAGLEAICTDEFNMHGVLATTMSVGPLFVVNGPIRNDIGMNSGINTMGPGNRANSTIGRAVALCIRNIGGGRPGEVDRATHGQPGKYGWCFPEQEESSPWDTFAESQDQTIAPGTNAITAFCADGAQCVVDQLSRDPESLCRSLAAAVRAVHHPKLVVAFDVMIVVGPEHGRVFADAGWDRAKVLERIHSYSEVPGSTLARGVDGMAEGLPVDLGDQMVAKCRPGGIYLVYAGGGAGLFSMVIGGWVSGAGGSDPVTVAIGT